jgi:hypothetical protein
LPIHRNIRINNLKSLYDNQDYPKLIEILSESLINVDVVSDSSISHITVQTQIEILLEALWATEHVEVVSFFRQNKYGFHFIFPHRNAWRGAKNLYSTVSANVFRIRTTQANTKNGLQM